MRRPLPRMKNLVRTQLLNFRNQIPPFRNQIPRFRDPTPEFCDQNQEYRTLPSITRACCTSPECCGLVPELPNHGVGQ